MSRDESRSDPSGSTASPPLTTGVHAQAYPDTAPSGSALQPRSQTNPSFFSSGAQPHLMAHGPESQMIRSVSLACRTPPSTLPIHRLSTQFSSGHQHTPYNSFTRQYMMPTHPFLFQGQPSQPRVYHGYQPLGQSPYPPAPYFPLPRNQPQPYFQYQSGVPGHNPPYQQVRHPLPLIPQVASGSSGPSHAESYGGVQQYPLPFYGISSHSGLPQQYQPSATEWYYGPNLSPDTFTESEPMRARQHDPTYSPRSLTQRSRGDSTTQSTASGRLSSPSLGASSSSNAVTASRNIIPPDVSDSPEQIAAPKMDTHEHHQQSGLSSFRSHDHPHDRRHYHPNPPPNRSEWVMWIGNVPNDATHDELLRFLKQSTPTPEGSGTGDNGVLSVFLISRSNCAFANYQSEEHLNRAITQLNGCKLRLNDCRCPRLVCRARRRADDLQAGVGAQRGMGVHTHYVRNVLHESLTTGKEVTSSKDEEAPKSDTVEGADYKIPAQSPNSYASTSSSFLARYFPTRFFILKSLTRHDLDLSIERGVWATQKHNEAILDQAFRTSKVVILIFSVNRSGEFYGYARMASGVSRGNHTISWTRRADSSPSMPSPSTSRVPAHVALEQGEGTSSPKPETYTSPSEHQFTEAGHIPLTSLPVHTKSGVKKAHQAQMSMPPATMRSQSYGQERNASWGETFQIEWLCTLPVQFHRTRHLRNPWNHGREIKVSRDGTELEPTVGQQLVDSWLTLAREPIGRRATGIAGGRGAKSIPKPGGPADSKGVKERPP